MPRGERRGHVALLATAHDTTGRFSIIATTLLLMNNVVMTLADRQVVAAAAAEASSAQVGNPAAGACCYFKKGGPDDSCDNIQDLQDIKLDPRPHLKIIMWVV